MNSIKLPVKAISLWEPWATAMAIGLKRNETRSRPASVGGDLVICSSKQHLNPLALAVARDNGIPVTALHFGFALCVVEVYDCRGVEWVSSQPGFSEIERALGDYSPGVGRYAWMTRNLRRLAKPVPVVGRQFLWNLPPETVAAITAQL